MDLDLGLAVAAAPSFGKASSAGDIILTCCSDRAICFAAEDLVQRMTELEVRLQQCRMEATEMSEARKAGAHAGDMIPGQQA